MTKEPDIPEGLDDEELAEFLAAQLEAEELSPKGIADTNRGLLRRQQHYRIAADFIVAAVSPLPQVQAVALIGSVAKKLWKEVPRFSSYRRERIRVWHECHDLDLALWVPSLDDLATLKRTINRALPRIYETTGRGVSPHEVDVFLFEPGSDRHLGRLCYYKECPAGKRDCLAPGCGSSPFLKKIPNFRLHSDALAPGNCVRLFERPTGLLRRAADLPSQDQAETDGEDAEA